MRLGEGEGADFAVVSQGECMHVRCTTDALPTPCTGRGPTPSHPFLPGTCRPTTFFFTAIQVENVRRVRTACPCAQCVPGVLAANAGRRFLRERQGTTALLKTPALTHWHASTHSLARLHSLAGTRAPGGGPRLHLALERALQAPQSGAHVRAVLRYSRHCGMLEQTHGRAYVTVARAGSPVADACASASRGFVICQRGNKRW